MMNNITEQDLMVGDLVQYGENPTIKTRVLAISSVDNGKHWYIQAEPENTNSTRVVAMHAVEPIPLTTEILEKNFPTIEDGVTWSETADSDLFNIRVEYDKYVECIFKYVHELQHALRLAGIDKEIEL
jgi:hypothetical protein